MDFQGTIAIIGGGAAGFFAAVRAAEMNPSLQIVIFEKTKEFLTKVRISGGGRCNVTHSCFDPKKLVQSYPRGYKELLGPFTRFQPQDTIDWFMSRGVILKTEEDGRIFPLSNQSQTIIDCLLSETNKYKIQIFNQKRVTQIKKSDSKFILDISSDEQFSCKKVLLATGGSSQGHLLAASLGHRIVDPVPSLFTFNVPLSPLKDLSGISLPYVTLTLPELNLQESGPLLLTHFGFSGPAALRLSAWGARQFYDRHYQLTLLINWAPQHTITEELIKLKQHEPHLMIGSKNPFAIPRKLWQRLIELSSISKSMTWSNISHKEIDCIAKKLSQDSYQISGKTINKEEFVTAGGVSLSEVSFKTMESKICPNLFFAGEVLDIDGITGGYNFQNAWTTGYLSGTAIA